MTMKCPVCGGTMEKESAFSGDLYQTNDFRYVCRRCGHGGPAGKDVLEEAVRSIQKRMEEKADG